MARSGFYRIWTDSTGMLFFLYGTPHSRQAAGVPFRGGPYPSLSLTLELAYARPSASFGSRV
jgi:hypothetical protein